MERIETDHRGGMVSIFLAIYRYNDFRRAGPIIHMGDGGYGHCIDTIKYHIRQHIVPCHLFRRVLRNTGVFKCCTSAICIRRRN